MNFIRGKLEARMLPSRHNFALFRLGAYFLLKVRPRGASYDDDRLFFVDRHQSASETYAVSLFVLAVTTSYLTAFLAPSLGLAAAIVLALPAAAILIEVPVWTTGLVLSLLARATGANVERHRNAANGFAVMLVLAASSLFFINGPAWVRSVALFALGAMLLNTVAAVVAWALRSSIVRLEEEIGGRPSAL